MPKSDRFWPKKEGWIFVYFVHGYNMKKMENHSMRRWFLANFKVFNKICSALLSADDRWLPLRCGVEFVRGREYGEDFGVTTHPPLSRSPFQLYLRIECSREGKKVASLPAGDQPARLHTSFLTLFLLCKEKVHYPFEREFVRGEWCSGDLGPLSVTTDKRSFSVWREPYKLKPKIPPLRAVFFSLKLQKKDPFPKERILKTIRF